MLKYDSDSSPFPLVNDTWQSPAQLLGECPTALLCIVQHKILGLHWIVYHNCFFGWHFSASPFYTLWEANLYIASSSIKYLLCFDFWSFLEYMITAMSCPQKTGDVSILTTIPFSGPSDQVWSCLSREYSCIKDIVSNSVTRNWSWHDPLQLFPKRCYMIDSWVNEKTMTSCRVPRKVTG